MTQPHVSIRLKKEGFRKMDSGLRCGEMEEDVEEFGILLGGVGKCERRIVAGVTLVTPRSQSWCSYGAQPSARLQLKLIAR